MGKLIVINHLTLDGVMQGPGRADEDTRDGFQRGGWAVPYGDQALVARMASGWGRTARFCSDGGRTSSC